MKTDEKRFNCLGKVDSHSITTGPCGRGGGVRCLHISLYDNWRIRGVHTSNVDKREKSISFSYRNIQRASTGDMWKKGASSKFSCYEIMGLKRETEAAAHLTVRATATNLRLLFCPSYFR